MIRLLLLSLIYIITIDGIHFDGGTITWEPVDPNINSSIVPIIISQSYSWTASVMNCSINVPISTSTRSGQNSNLTCVDNCATDGGYSNDQIDILTDCQTVSLVTNVMTSQRSHTVDLLADAYFSLQNAGGHWVALNYPPQSSLTWSLVCSIDIRFRPDGFINTAPVASVVSPQFALVNQTTLITVPVSDANTGDDVRCRWAVNASSNTLPGADECAGICYPTSLPNGTTLSNCTVSFLGLIPGVWYGVAIQVEDFINSTSLTPMSSVPVQFLIYVVNQSACGLSPVMLPLETCFDVQVGVPMSFNMSAMTQCYPNISYISAINVASGITGMNMSNLTDSLTNESVSYVTFTWTPSISQLGSQQLCVLSYTNESLQSPQYCVTFNVISSPPVCYTTSTSTTSTTSTTSVTTKTSRTTSTTSASTPTTTITRTSSTTSASTPTTTITRTSSTTSASTPTTTITRTSSTTSVTTTVTFSTTVTSTTSASTIGVTIAMINTILQSNSSKQRAMWLAFFLPVVLLFLCCSCFTLYCWYWTVNDRRRQGRTRRIVIYKRFRPFF